MKIASADFSTRARSSQESGALFVFVNKRRNRMKVLWFDRNGFCLLYKRLHRARFSLPEDRAIDSRKLTLLLGPPSRTIAPYPRPRSMVFPNVAYGTPRRLPPAASLPGGVVVLDIAFASEAGGTSFEKVTGRFIDALGAPRAGAPRNSYVSYTIAQS